MTVTRQHCQQWTALQQRQWMARLQRGGGNGDGRRDGNGNGWRDGKVVARTVMGRMTETAIARQRRATTATESTMTMQRQ